MKTAKQSIWTKIIDFTAGGWMDAYHDMQSGINKIAGKSVSTKVIISLVLTIVISWFIYVPIHEMLHVGGCIATGGSVDKLVMGKEYGAVFLKEIFPFIEPQTTRYAGRLTGFDPSNDFGYFVTVFAPFLLTPIPGIMAIRFFQRHGRAWLLAIGILIGLAPFWNLTGDYFEMGTIISTLGVNLLTAGASAQSIPSFWELRSDDIFRLFEEISAEPNLYGLSQFSTLLMTGLVIVAGLLLAIALAGWTYRGSGWLVDTLFFKKKKEESA